MQLTALVLAFAAAASALDIRYYNDTNCGGGAAFYCTGINPNTCCTSEAVHHPSVGFAAIPTNWKITTRGYINGGCRDLRATEDLYNINFGCLHPGGSVFTGASYNFRNKKMVRGATPEDACEAEAEHTCMETVKPDMLSLEDGQKYNIADMDMDLLKPLTALAFNGTLTAGIPAVYQKFEIGE